MHLTRTLLTLAAVAAGALAPAQRGGGGLPEKEALLDAVVKANMELRCRGVRKIVVRFEKDGRAVSREFREVVIRDRQKSRTEYIGDDSIAGQIAVDDGKNRYHYFPKENVIHRSPSLQHQNSERLELMMKERRKEYTIGLSEGGRVAEYSTYLLTLKSSRGFTHKLWVDKGGKAILRRDFEGPDKNRGSSYEFESFEYRRRVDEDNFEIRKQGARVLGPEDRLALAAKKVEYTPYAVSGDSKFKLYESGTFEAGGDKVRILRSVYGDGKVVVTLHQFRGSLDPDKLKGRGGRVHFWRADGYNFVLVGDLPASELERLARLVRR